MKRISDSLQAIIDRSFDGFLLNRAEIIQLLSYPESSPEASWIRIMANQLSRQRFNNHGTISAQIGFETSPCEGDCNFCVFAASHTTFPSTKMTVEEVVYHAKALTKDGILSLLWLMAMHRYDRKHLLEIIAAVREVIPPWTILASNIGDMTLAEAKELKAAGLSSAYHIIRLREGTDTRLDPKQRLETIHNIQEAGLGWSFCCEPIGPEHTNEELADQILLGLSLHPNSFSAMRRVRLPNSPLAKYGQITHRRLAQIVATITLAVLGDPGIHGIGCHESYPLALCSGSNSTVAESGANPRDEEVETAKNRGLSVSDCAQMLWEAGFDGIIRGNNEMVSFKEWSGTQELYNSCPSM